MQRSRLLAALLFASGPLGCAEKGASEPAADTTLVLAAYSATRDAFDRALIPAFEAEHRARTGKTLRVRASYLASGAQSRSRRASATWP